MEPSTKPLLILSIIILLAVIFSYFDLKSSLHEQPTDTMPAAGATITIGGVGSNITFNSGGGNCSPTSAGIKAEASISGGTTGNTITVKASCSLSNFSATTTSTDPGTGLADYTSNTTNPGQGRASCDTTYTGVADSAWTAVCTF